jgi:hypothetical protein
MELAPMARRTGRLAALAAVLVCLLAAPAHAAIGITSFEAETQANSHTPDPALAGAHPDVVIDLVTDNPEPDIVRERMRMVNLDLPEGMVFDAASTPQCPRHVFLGFGVYCPDNTIVGEVDIDRYGPDVIPRLYNLEPLPGEAGALGIKYFTNHEVYGIITAHVGPDGNYRIKSRVDGTWLGAAVRSMEIRMFGTPEGATRPFVTNPTRCDVAPVVDVAIDSYQAPNVFATASDELQTPTGCETLPFAPKATVIPENRGAGAPTGLDVDLEVPQDSTPWGRGSATLKRAVLRLPEGMRVSASSANGLAACSPAQIAVQSDSEPQCPDASKIGSVRVDSHVLNKPLEGGIHLATPHDNPFGSLLAVYLVAEGDGVVLKLPGRVDVDEATGQLTITFDDNPQMPFSKLEVDLKTGPRAALSNPSSCGDHTVSLELESWDGQSVVSESVFSTSADGNGGACQVPPAFAPGLSAGTLNPVAGGFSPFAARIVRPDGERELDRIDMDLPEGLLAKLRGVTVCSNGQAALAAARSGVAAQRLVGCPANSQIGSVTVGAGPGSDPFYPRLPGSDVSGRVFLTEAYGSGAEYGLAIEVPAVAGPIDLGNVVVRARVDVDPETAKLRVVSDSLPRMLQGIPLQLRDVRVNIDRPGFTVNPTSCEPSKVDGTLHAVGGGSVDRSSRFQVGECAGLAFTPRLGMRLAGRKQMRSGGHPVLRATLRQGDGQANVERAKVTLPPNVVLDSKNSVDPELLCGYDAAQRADCPASSVIGKASLKTPLLNKPLSGPVHFVQGIRFGKDGTRIRTLPTLLVKLRGEVAINLRSKTDTDSRDRLVSIFPTVPDARAGRFDLQINGGKKGILVVTENRRGRINLCNRKQTALAKTSGHNGKRADYPIRVKTACAKKRKR